MLTGFRRVQRPIGALGGLVFVAAWALPALAQADVSAPSQTACSTETMACEDRGELSLKTAVQLTLRANRDLAVAAREIDVQSGVAEQAGLRKNPVLSTDAENIQRPERNTTVWVSQLIELGRKRSARVAAAPLSRDAATHYYLNSSIQNAGSRRHLCHLFHA